MFNENRKGYEDIPENRDPVLSLIQGAEGQAKKSAGRMPWHWEPKKDVISCEKLR